MTDDEKQTAENKTSKAFGNMVRACVRPANDREEALIAVIEFLYAECDRNRAEIDRLRWDFIRAKTAID